jgi:hypothetical protein
MRGDRTYYDYEKYDDLIIAIEDLQPEQKIIIQPNGDKGFVYLIT